MAGGAELFTQAIAGIRVAFGSAVKIYSEARVTGLETTIKAIEDKIKDLNSDIKDAQDLAKLNASQGIGDESRVDTGARDESVKTLIALNKELADQKINLAASTEMVNDNYQAIKDADAGYDKLIKRIGELSAKTAKAPAISGTVQAANEAAKTIDTITTTSANKQLKTTEKQILAQARAQKKAHDDELKNLQDYNQLKYAKDIAAGEKMGEDSWLAQEKGIKDAMSRAEDYQEKETQAVYDAEQDRLKIKQDALEKHAEAVKDANDDMLDTIQDYTADIIKDWDNAGDMLIDIAKRTAAEMAAAFISQQFIMPVVQMIGSAAGLSWNGISMTDMLGASKATTSGTSDSSSTGWGSYLSGAQSLYGLYTGATSSALFSGLTSGVGSTIGTGIFGSSWLGATGTGATGALAGSGLGYGGMSTIGAGSTGGIASSLASALPIVAIIAAVETYFGSKNTESGRYTNVDGNGTNIGDAWSGSFFNDPAMEWVSGEIYGIDSVHSSLAYLDAAIKGGGFADILKEMSASALEMTILDPLTNALLGNPISKLFGHTDVDSRIDMYSSGTGGLADSETQGSNFRVGSQDIGDGSTYRASITDYFDNYFSVIDDAISWSMSDVMKNSTFMTQVDPTIYTDSQTMIDEMTAGIFEDIRANLVEQVVSGQGASFDMDFFKEMQTEGEDLFQTFAKFAAFADSVENFSARINEQMGNGATATEAFENILAIQEVLYAVKETASGIATSSSIDAIRGLITAQGDYLTALKAATATESELAAV